MIPDIISDKIGKSPVAIPVGVGITGYGGYKIYRKDYLAGITWVVTGVGIVKAGLENGAERIKPKDSTPSGKVFQ